MNRVQHVALSVGAVISFFLLWQVVGAEQWIDPLLLPPLSDIALTAKELLQEGYRQVPLWQHIAVSVARALSAFAVAILVGVPLGLIMGLTVRDNVSFGPRMQGATQEDILPETQAFLKLVGLQGFEDHYPWQLSGGMKQRVAMARAWLPNPDVLLMDEPFGALDAQTRLMMQELLLSAWQQTGTTILFVTHDVEEALFLADRILIMSAHPGCIVDEIRLPFGRQRDIETLAHAEGYSEIKQRVLHRVRSEARRHFND